jgi:translation machinery-associated protein 16
MPRALHKVSKHITKKKGKNLVLHENSRDSRMLLRAGARDHRVQKVTSLREKINRPYSKLAYGY